jgi:hypothetical protein
VAGFRRIGEPDARALFGDGVRQDRVVVDHEARSVDVCARVEPPVLPEKAAHVTPHPFWQTSPSSVPVSVAQPRPLVFGHWAILLAVLVPEPSEQRAPMVVLGLSVRAESLERFDELVRAAHMGHGG